MLKFLSSEYLYMRDTSASFNTKYSNHCSNLFISMVHIFISKKKLWKYLKQWKRYRLKLQLNKNVFFFLYLSKTSHILLTESCYFHAFTKKYIWHILHSCTPKKLCLMLAFFVIKASTFLLFLELYIKFTEVNTWLIKIIS